MYIIVITIINLLLLIALMFFTAFVLMMIEGIGEQVKIFTLANYELVIVNYWYVYILMFVSWYWRFISDFRKSDSIWSTLGDIYSESFPSLDFSKVKSYGTKIRINAWEDLANVAGVDEGLVIKSKNSEILYIPWGALKSIFVIKEKSGEQEAKVSLASSGKHNVAFHISWREELKAHLPPGVKYLERNRK